MIPQAAPPVSPIELRLQRMESKLDRLLQGPESPVIGLRDVMFLTGCKSVPAVYRMIRFLKLKPFSRGKYDRDEVINAIGRRRLELSQQSKT